SINNLLLDLDNPRFPRIVESQRDAVNLMLDIQQDKIESLARDIVEYGLDPSERLIAFPSDTDDSMYIVAEGNRRITALKLLHEPDLADNDKLSAKFRKILQTNPVLPDTVDCAVFDEAEEFQHWISLKHSGQNNGVGRVRWDTKEQERYLAKHGISSFGNQFIKFIENEPLLGNEILSKTKLLKLTNITRLLGDPDVRVALSIEVSEGTLYCSQSKASFITNISKILSAMQDQDSKGRVLFTVNRIRHKTDRLNLLGELGIIKPTDKIKPYWKLSEPQNYKEEESSQSPLLIQNTNNNKVENIADNKSSTSENKEIDIAQNTPKENSVQSNEKKPVPSSPNNSSVKLNSSRNNLIPSNIKLVINNKKCSAIYNELKKDLRHDDHPMSISMLFRAFLEISLTCYLDDHKITLGKQQQGLHDKVVAVSNHLKDRNLLTNAETTSVQA
ncbi:hypothetical protein, partial [Shewanella sp.]|uniref:hypothetical protein n=1 Tax=Shewanella sp. TaxID=50422 RepID=UPI000E85AF89